MSGTKKQKDGGRKSEVSGQKSKPGGQSPDSGALTSKSNPRVVHTAEVVKASAAYTGLARHSEDESQLQALGMSIRRDLEDSRKCEQAAALLGVRIGIALNAGKAICRYGAFEDWAGNLFDDMKRRQMYYYLKLAKVFLNEAGGQFQLPAPQETGAWLVKANDRSTLGEAVLKFIGNMSLNELFAKYSIKPQVERGGFRPSAYMVAKYQGEHKELAGVPFEQWTAEQKAAFQEWQAKEIDVGGEGDAERMAAEEKWANIRATLAEHGVKRRSFAFLTKKQIGETRDVVVLVLKELGKALK